MSTHVQCSRPIFFQTSRSIATPWKPKFLHTWILSSPPRRTSPTPVPCTFFVDSYSWLGAYSHLMVSMYATTTKRLLWKRATNLIGEPEALSRHLMPWHPWIKGVCVPVYRDIREFQPIDDVGLRRPAAGTSQIHQSFSGRGYKRNLIFTGGAMGDLRLGKAELDAIWVMTTKLPLEWWWDQSNENSFLGGAMISC